MSDSLDRPLRWDEWLALKGHFLACRVCPKLLRQLKLIRDVSHHDHPDVSHIGLSSGRQRSDEASDACCGVETAVTDLQRDYQAPIAFPRIELLVISYAVLVISYAVLVISYAVLRHGIAAPSSRSTSAGETREYE